ncbi:hypothetical protein [Mesorhizobium sp. M0220]|uniref:hypothetical protein n=1 Tax=Mesorhizobium sp. M0220 TaxID=2956920 RepID=UPI003336653F
MHLAIVPGEDCYKLFEHKTDPYGERRLLGVIAFQRGGLFDLIEAGVGWNCGLPFQQHYPSIESVWAAMAQKGFTREVP